MTNYEDLPGWVIQIVSELELYEDHHAKGEVCLKSILERVPNDVRAFAKGWSRGPNK